MRARWIVNTGNFRDFKSGQKDYKVGQGFQIGAEITQCSKIIRRDKLIFKSLIQENFYVYGLLFVDFMFFLSVLSRLIYTNFLKYLKHLIIKHF